MPVDHFLDANIIIASRINWHIKCTACKNYLDSEANRCTSTRVYYECRDVFEGIKDTIRPFLDEILVAVFTRNPQLIEGEIKAYTKNYCDNHPNLSLKQKDDIINYVDGCSNDIKNAYLGGTDEINKYILHIKNTMVDTIRRFGVECRPRQGVKIYRYYCQPDIDTIYPLEYTALYAAINYHNDVLVLLDSYDIKFRHMDGNNIHFYTMDWTHILNHKTIIEQIINGVFIREPN